MPRGNKTQSQAESVQNDAAIPAAFASQAKNTKSRNTAPKEVITLILDAARSSVKFTAIFKEQVINCPKLPSVFAELENPLHQELGAFSVGLKPKVADAAPSEKKPLDEVKHYVVGDRATLEINPVAMTQGHNHKIDYFYLLALGAISSIPNLYSLSTGTSSKSRILTLKMVVLSLADGKALLDQLKQCRWLKVNAVKYRLNFLLNHSLYFAEGYGSAIWAKKELSLQPLDPANRDVTVFDIGYGTACQTDYVCYGDLPLKRFVETNGGGGLSSLVTFLSRAMARGDSSRLIPTSEVRQILEDSKFVDGKVKALANDGRDVSEALERAIQWWMADSPLSFALDSVSLAARRQPVILVGGSFRIPAIKEKIKQRLIIGGALEGFVLTPDNPEILSVQGMVELFCKNELLNQETLETPQEPKLQVLTNGDSNQQEAELQRSTEASEPNPVDSSPTRYSSSVLDSQSA